MVGEEKIRRFYYLLYKYIKDKIFTVISATILVLFLIPICIFLCYFIGDNFIVLLNTELKVGEALGFYGVMLSAGATLSLGIISLWQTKKAYSLNEDMNKQALIMANKTEIVPMNIRFGELFLTSYPNSLIGVLFEDNKQVLEEGYYSGFDLAIDLQCLRFNYINMIQVNEVIIYHDFKEQNNDIALYSDQEGDFSKRTTFKDTSIKLYPVECISNKIVTVNFFCATNKTEVTGSEDILKIWNGGHKCINNIKQEIEESKKILLRIKIKALNLYNVEMEGVIEYILKKDGSNYTVIDSTFVPYNYQYYPKM